MNKRLRLPSHKSWQPLLRKAAAVAVVLGLGASGVAAWAANDNTGGGTGSGGSGSGTGGTVEVKWMVKDSWAASRDGVLQALSDMGYPENSGYEHDGNIATIDSAISDAVNECRAAYSDVLSSLSR